MTPADPDPDPDPDPDLALHGMFTRFADAACCANSFS